MRIAIIGAGALGCMFGGLLEATGHDVWLLHHREEYVEQLVENGIRIVSEDRDLTIDSVSATTDAGDVGVVDLAFLLVKSHQTDDAIEDHEACIGPETHVLSLQNGFRVHEQLSRYFDDEQILYGATYRGVVLESPGHVRCTFGGETIFGGEDDAFCRTVADALVEAGIEASVIDQLDRHLWGKQLWSIAIKPLAAITGLPNHALVTNQHYRKVMARAIDETRSVAAEEGIDDLPTTDEVIEKMVGKAPRWRSGWKESSMLQDVQADRKTEIEEINGAIVDLGARNDVDVPTNRMLTDMVRGLESHYLE